MPAFRNKTIAAMRPRFEALADELVDAFAARGRVELISEFAEPYSARIICVLLGLPEDHWPQVAHWADDLGKAFGTAIAADLPRIEAALDGLYGYVDEVVATRRRSPADDLVSTLVRGPGGRRSLARTSSASRWCSWRWPAWRRPATRSGWPCRRCCGTRTSGRCWASRPELGASAVEEVMRVNPTVTWVTREALETVDLGDGLVVPPGGIVQVLSHAAGTDPSAMPDPSFDITAQRPPHLGFGAGAHHCLGHFVARTDMAVALPLLARRMPDAVARRPRLLAAGLGQHRRAGVPDRVQRRQRRSWRAPM